MQHEAGRWREEREDAPVQQPMRAGLKPAERKAPTSDQKRVRREMGRKTADLAGVGTSATPADQALLLAYHQGHQAGTHARGGHPGNPYFQPHLADSWREGYGHGRQGRSPQRPLPEGLTQVPVKKDLTRGAAKVAYDYTDFLDTVTSTFDATQAARQGSAQPSDSTTSNPGATSAHSGASASTGVTGAKTAEHRGDLGYAPGERTCQACGHTAHPAMGDTGPVCSVCGSYALTHPRSAPSREQRGETAEYRTATLIPTRCPVCEGSVVKQASGCSACTTCGCRVSEQPTGEPRMASLSAPQSAVARRAAEVYELMKETPL